MLRKSYRQKPEIVYDLLNSMSSKRMMLNTLCMISNLDNNRLHKYLNVLIERGLIEKYKILGRYDNALYEYNLTQYGRAVLKSLKESNDIFGWIFII